MSILLHDDSNPNDNWFFVLRVSVELDFFRPERGELSTKGMAWVVAFAFAARCGQAGFPPATVRLTRAAARTPWRRTERAKPISAHDDIVCW